MEPVSQNSSKARAGGLRLALVVLALSLSLIGIILALTFAYRQLWNAPVDAATNLGKALVVGVKGAFGVSPRITINQTVVVQEATPIFELATVNRQTTVHYEYHNQWLGSEKVLNISGQFRIKGGFDLSKPSALDVQSRPLKIIARFPPPKVLSVELISHEIDKSQNGLWNRLSLEDQKEAVDALIRTAKLEAGASVTREAKKNLEDKLRELVQGKGTDIQFQYGGQ